MKTKQDYLKETIKHIDIKKHNVVELVDSFKDMAFQAEESLPRQPSIMK